MRRLAAALLTLAALLAACGPSDKAAEGQGAPAASASMTLDAASAPASPKASPSASPSGSTTKAGSSKGAWPPADACTVVKQADIEKALGVPLTDPPKAKEGSYGPSCYYNTDLATPMATVDTWTVDDLHDNLKFQKDMNKTLIPVSGVGSEANLIMSNPNVADVILYVVSGNKAVVVQVAVYGGDGSFTSTKATDAAKAIAKLAIA
jgi:hypothetical protein